MPPRTNDDEAETRPTIPGGDTALASATPEAELTGPDAGALGAGAEPGGSGAEAEAEQAASKTESDRPEAESGACGSDAAVPETAHVVPHSHASPSGTDHRVAAVRRVGASGRRWRAAQLVGCAALLAVALTGGAIAVGAARDGGSAVAVASSAVDPGVLGSGNLDASIAALQAHLRSQPRDFGSWATLGLAYVEQARTKGDPARYPQAEKALKRSLALNPRNDQALAGRAALAAARHDFKDALTYADQALKQNPYSERALSSRIDALVELGRYAEADGAAKTADTRKPGVPVFTRYAYVHELRGDVTTARRVLKQALAVATSRGDVAYVAAQLGQLAWNQGEYTTALTYYARALAADENYLPALEGRARAQAADGHRDEAIKGLETVVSRYPLPGPLVELGELYEARGAAGDKARARDQYALVDAWIALARANGVNADLDTALAAADHGDKASALRAARAEWARRHTVHTADALAWALHVNGRDKEALPYARRATATGYRSAAFLYHRGMIELATGHTEDGRASLRAALKLNPGFSPLGAARARKALEAAR
ncbi:tetratricopeptide repeat protein [Streptomyces diastatochromogenes]|uniref:tetratricopeptide repeat protein n=1 Tax=Streptomyces diastatochromogenes TaxID=42236 RepID=UPI000B918B44|nr:tetratricopeptide repeat protein [Streptomyces diastatochromogenes]